MRTFSMAALVLTSIAPCVAAAVAPDGADVVRDREGRIVEVSLARTWATDRDMEWIAGLKDLKRLDLSLTYISDRGIERLSKLEQLEELNLDTAESITDAAVAFLRASSAATAAYAGRRSSPMPKWKRFRNSRGSKN
jgi:hypothetical protein